MARITHYALRITHYALRITILFGLIFLVSCKQNLEAPQSNSPLAKYKITSTNKLDSESSQKLKLLYQSFTSTNSFGNNNINLTRIDFDFSNSTVYTHSNTDIRTVNCTALNQPDGVDLYFVGAIKPDNTFGNGGLIVKRVVQNESNFKIQYYNASDGNHVGGIQVIDGKTTRIYVTDNTSLRANCLTSCIGDTLTSLTNGEELETFAAVGCLIYGVPCAATIATACFVFGCLWF